MDSLAAQHIERSFAFWLSADPTRAMIELSKTSVLEQEEWLTLVENSGDFKSHHASLLADVLCKDDDRTGALMCGLFEPSDAEMERASARRVLHPARQVLEELRYRMRRLECCDRAFDLGLPFCWNQKSSWKQESAGRGDEEEVDGDEGEEQEIMEDKGLVPGTEVGDRSVTGGTLVV